MENLFSKTRINGNRDESKKKYGKVAEKNSKITKICMFSGGLDSCIGALNLLCDTKDISNLVFVSHYGGGKGQLNIRKC